MKVFKILFGRTTLTALFVLLEVIWMLLTLKWFASQWAWLEAGSRILSLVLVVFTVDYTRHPSSAMMWVVLMMAFPLAGTFLYLFLEVMDRFSSKTYRAIRQETKTARKYYAQDPEVLKNCQEQLNGCGGQAAYLWYSGGFPVYANTGYTYYGWGEEAWPVMLEELKKAEHFIFVEYFIIEEGEFWNSILAVLKEKAAQGVDVRVLYDDMGSMGTLPASYARKLNASSQIKIEAFNKISPFLNGIMNHRDHRKILVVDGKVGFTGGINLADEYINKKILHGRWKDNAVRLEGQAVWSLTVLFLTTWNALRHEDEDYEKFHVQAQEDKPAQGWVAPYGETPLDHKLLGQDVYLNILNQAKDYVYIFTPYLIIDTDMTNALIRCAQRGVDVRLITPGIPDKKIIWRITRSYYRPLLEEGVKIYQYTPGFDHAKVFVCDDRIATVGTLNLDYRSLYLHFENGTWLAGSPEVLKIRDDFLRTQQESHLVRASELQQPLVLFYTLVRLFAPLM